MKIIFVNEEQFNWLWTKLPPHSRISSDLKTPNLVFQHLNTVVLIRNYVKLGTIESLPNEAGGTSRFERMILDNTFTEL